MGKGSSILLVLALTSNLGMMLYFGMFMNLQIAGQTVPSALLASGLVSISFIEVYVIKRLLRREEAE
mgnify:FL=1